MKDNRSKFQIRVAAAKRLLMWHFLNKTLNLVLVSEFPKSGGSWFCQMFSEATELPFPRNISPNLESCIMHGHHTFHPRFGKMLGILRDGRDVMVSAYYHFLFEHDRNPPYSVVYHRNQTKFKNFEDIKSNMPAFIKYMFEDFARGRFHLSWSDFVNGYCDNENVYIVKYENLLMQAVTELENSTKFLGVSAKNKTDLENIVKKYSFKNQSKRKPGEENKKSFLRKGIAGDWKNNFTNEAAEVFNFYAGKEIIKAGYEQNENWF